MLHDGVPIRDVTAIREARRTDTEVVDGISCILCFMMYNLESHHETCSKVIIIIQTVPT